MSFRVPEKYRNYSTPHDYEAQGSNDGQFLIPYRENKYFFCQASQGMGWEHVSISLIVKSKKKTKFHPVHRTPTWDEMCIIKDHFWGENDTVLQIHPPKSEYVSTHPYVLHLWKSTEHDFKRPLPIMVGIAGDDKQRL